MFRALLTGPAHGLVGKIRVHMYQQQIDSSQHSDLHHRLPAAVRLDQTSRFSARWMQVMGSLGRSPLESGSRAQASPAHTERRALSRDSAPYWETVRKTGSRSFQPLLVTPTPLAKAPGKHFRAPPRGNPACHLNTRRRQVRSSPKWTGFTRFCETVICTGMHASLGKEKGSWSVPAIHFIFLGVLPA